MKYAKIFLIVVLGFIITACNNKSDALKFKDEYESLNYKISESGDKYKKLSISDSNPIKYSNYEEILNIIENGTGIIYLGYPECPWCRTAIEVLLDIADDYDIEKIYYMNMHDERDYYEVKNGKLVYKKDKYGNEIKGNNGYFKLLKALDNELEEYVIKLDEKEYNVGEKRIYVPLVIFVKDGDIIGTHTATVSSQKSGYDNLTSKQYDELSDIYAEYIAKLSNNVCTDAC